MVCVGDDGASDGSDAVEDVCEGGSVTDREKRLGEPVGEGTEASA
jgi:hypothetical protein